MRLGAVVSEIEGLYTALRTTPGGPRRDRILTDLAQAGRRLTALALDPRRDRGGVPPRSRWERRRHLAARGAELVSVFLTGWAEGRRAGDREATHAPGSRHP
ncbi:MULTISPECIES: hypothetical protein [Streptomyces]|uniref:Uncharacterized protein n=1 Tax=Streptomyces ehimensis TaxID=68195 RepID=A0ABV9BRK8_9ACTN